MAIALACAVTACAAASKDTTNKSGTSGGPGGGAAGGGGAGGSGGSGIGPIGGAGGSGSPPAKLVAYAHTDKTLFRIDPSAPNLGVTQVGDFDCIGGPGQDSTMTDLAVDGHGELWGISASAVYHLAIQGSAVHCLSTVPLNNARQVRFYALTFAPAGVLDPNKEVLVAGNSDGELWAIDSAGNLTLHGNFGTVPTDDGHGHTYPVKNRNQRWELSGDIVFLANGGAPLGFATVRDCPSPPSSSGCSKTDTLIQIDVGKLKEATTQPVTKAVRGQIVKRADCTDPANPDGYGSMYGIAAWNDKVYGFSRSGAIVAIDNNDGGACLVQTTANDLWAGAGVTTLAPVEAPPPS